MEGTCESKSESLAAGVYELPGEPAVVINGVPDIPLDHGNSSTIQGDSLAGGISMTAKLGKFSSDTEKPRNTGFGGWLKGREVRKLFGDKYYSGTVIEFDKETGWYRVVYEDGDFEDLEWHELQDVLQPLDISMPLKSLALKMIRKTQKSEPGIETIVIPERESAGGKGGLRSTTRGTSSNTLIGSEE